jgi:hypothetical protein
MKQNFYAFYPVNLFFIDLICKILGTEPEEQSFEAYRGLGRSTGRQSVWVEIMSGQAISKQRLE